MTDGAELESLIDSLEALADEAEENRGKWNGVWGEIKNIGQAFKDSRFPTAHDRQAAWKRFQSIVARVKVCQQRAKTEFAERIRESESHLEQIRSYANSASPSSDLADAILAICTGGLSAVLEAGMNAILGPFDERKYELQKCSQVLKEGWAYFTQHKSEMLGRHKQQAFAALRSASDSLDGAWETWMTGRREAIGSYRAEKQAAWQARQAKREAWEARMNDNISKLEDRLGRLEGVLDRRQSHLSHLEDMRGSAWSDSYRDRVDGWISEEHDRISDIEGKISQIRGWISEMKAKLR